MKQQPERQSRTSLSLPPALLAAARQRMSQTHCNTLSVYIQILIMREQTQRAANPSREATARQ